MPCFCCDEQSDEEILTNESSDVIYEQPRRSRKHSNRSKSRNKRGNQGRQDDHARPHNPSLSYPNESSNSRRSNYNNSASSASDKRETNYENDPNRCVATPHNSVSRGRAIFKDNVVQHRSRRAEHEQESSGFRGRLETRDASKGKRTQTGGVVQRELLLGPFNLLNDISGASNQWNQSTNEHTPRAHQSSLRTKQLNHNKHSHVTEQQRRELFKDNVNRSHTIQQPGLIKPLTPSRIIQYGEQDESKVKHIAEYSFTWEIHDLIHDEFDISLATSQKLVKLFEEGNTIPFLARHRKDVIGKMTTEELRKIKNTFDGAIDLQEDIKKTLNQLHRKNIGSHELYTALMNVKSREALEEIYAPYKAVIDKEEADKLADLLKWEKLANLALEGKWPANVNTESMRLVIAKIGSSQASMELLRRVCKNGHCAMRCDKVENNDEIKQEEVNKYVSYYNRTFNTKDLRRHQILAINRAENLQFLTVTLAFFDFSHLYYDKMRSTYKKAMYGPYAADFDSALQLCYESIALPLLHKMKRTALTCSAEQAQLEVYASNLKQLLLTMPVKNRRILGVDPGTSLGCKLGLISETGEMLATGVVFPKAENQQRQKRTFRNMLQKHNCTLIALGNGTGCRDTQSWIANMIAEGFFDPLEVSYTIVNECGTSIYSCSKEAIREFKGMDPNLIGAISLARRVQDPLSEWVKVEPQHMGIGMYQLDMDPKRLEEALTEVVRECVSFVGVDINTASQCLLKHVAGLSEHLAGNIIAHRTENGDFDRREEIYQVDGINQFTYQQCASFLRILNGINKLDQTSIHPESYAIITRILKCINMKIGDIGTEEFMRRFQGSRNSLINIHQQLGIGKEHLEGILNGLVEKDIRDALNCEQLFRRDVTRLDDVTMGMELTGIVRNPTPFGVFIDIGVEIDGFIHVSKTKGRKLRIGEKVSARVCNLEVERRRIGLQLI